LYNIHDDTLSWITAGMIVFGCCSGKQDRSEVGASVSSEAERQQSIEATRARPTWARLRLPKLYEALLAAGCPEEKALAAVVADYLDRHHLLRVIGRTFSKS